MWHNTRLMNALANALFALALMAVVGVGLAWMVRQPAFAIQSVQVVPSNGATLRHLSPALVNSLVQRQFVGFTKPGIQHTAWDRYFFTLQLDTIRAKFEQLPWVRSANVKRVWPNRLLVEIEEHKPVAVWGDERLVNTQGELFAANLAEAEEDGPLPEFSGPNDASAQILKRYSELIGWLAPLNLRPENVQLSARHAWTIKLDDGTTLLLGREQGVAMEDRIAKWVESVPRVQSRLSARPEVYDLRYPNGFAIRSVALTDEAGKLNSAGTATANGTAKAADDAAKPTNKSD